MNGSRDPFNLRNKSGPALDLLRNSANTIQQQALRASQKIVSSAKDFDDIGLNKKHENIQDHVDESKAATMSYALPQNGPTHRHGGGGDWSRIGEGGQANGGAISEKMNDMFNTSRRDSLPMYKDKPKGFYGSSRRMPWFRKKRTVAVVLGSLAGLSWWFGILSPLSYFSSSSGTAATGGSSSSSSSSWGLIGGSKGGKVDWDERAERVKDAFKISWAGYEKYAWGMSRPA